MSKLPAEPKTGLPVPDGWDLEMWKFVKSLQLSGDLRFLLVSRDANGTSLKFNLQALLKEIEQAVSAPAGSSDYNGYFKLSAEGTKIYVKDGADSESTVAGYTIAGNNRIAVAIANFTVAVSGVVYIKTTWNGSAFVSVLLNASQLPIASNGIDIKLVGEYNFSSGAASIISQRLQGENLITGRIC